MAIHPEQLWHLSLCAGTGGIDLGFKLLFEQSLQTIAYVEWETYAAATLVARMGDKALDPAPIWDDVKTFNGRPWRGIVDIISGGYPCQPFSCAGLRKGEQDPRHIWPDIKRIVAEISPSIVFFENVKDHLSLGFDRVRNDLQELGYRVKSGLFMAKETGNVQDRKRLFILGFNGGELGNTGGRGCKGEPRRGAREEPENGCGELENPNGSGCKGALGGELENAGSGRQYPNPIGSGISLFPPGSNQFEKWLDYIEQTVDQDDYRRAAWLIQEVEQARTVIKDACGLEIITENAIRVESKIEPSVCGVASRLPPGLGFDKATFTEGIRCMGNSVSPIVAAFAFVNLWVEMMGEI